MKPTPKPILINTGGQEESGIQKIINDFFEETVRELERNNPQIKKYLTIIVAEHQHYGTPSNNRTTYLSYGEGRPLALVMETRTEFNWINYTFFRNKETFDQIIPR